MYEAKYHNEDLSGLSVLVTGGAGFIGSNIVEYLIKYGIGKVRILDNLSTGYLANIEKYLSLPNVEFIQGDIRDLKICEQACEGIDFVLHQAALGSVPRSILDPITSNDVNITGFLNMLMAVKNSSSVKRMVYAASSSTYGDSKELPKVEERIGRPLSPYAVTKYVNELYADVFSKTYGMEIIGLRYFNVFGPRQNVKGPYAAVIPLFIESALKNNAPTINGDGETSRDFTFIENAVQANIKAMLAPKIEKHEVCNIAFGERTTLNMLWEYITNVAQIEIKPNYQHERVGDIKHSLANIGKANELIGYKPLFSVFDGIKITYDWYRSNQ
ncbi:SDR family oxidoreductase [Emticicia sp. 17c]|uniref:SDR family oxidoreductase n=1 Tax=Emticicia sp. 17c TaxID=3127704 RepID=UPI00301D4F8B